MTVGGSLSPRELDVLRELADGAANAAEVGKRLHISHNTVRVHMRHVREKLGVPSQAAAVAAVLRAGLLT